MARLEGRTAIVTGGAVGIGRHYSEALAAEGEGRSRTDRLDQAEEPAAGLSALIASVVVQKFPPLSPRVRRGNF